MLEAPETSKLSTTEEALKMSSLVPIEVLAETTLPNIATKVASEPIDASQTSMTKVKDVKVRITKTTNL